MATERNNNQVPSLQVKSNAGDLADVVLWGDPTTHRLLTDGNVTVVGNGTIGDGSKSTVTAGTRVQLSATTVPCKKVHVQAKIGNTGSIYVGGATVASGRGIELLPTNTITLTVSDLNLVYIDSSVNAEGVTYTYEN